MSRNVISPEEGKRLEGLLLEHADASQRAAATLKAHGMESREFLDAEHRAGEIWKEIRKLRGDAGKHWMA